MKQSKEQMKTNDMTTGNPLRHIIRFAAPLFVGTVFQQLYQFADTMIAGHSLGDRAIAAIGATSAIYSLLISFANGLNSGYGLVLARAFGAKDTKLLRKAVAAMLLLDAAITIALTMAALLFIKPILHLLDTPADIFSWAHTYIVVILGGMLMTIFYNMCAAFLRAVGNSRVPLYFLVFSCAVNIALDLVFLVGLKAGVEGAAAATVIAEGVSALCCGLYICKNYKAFLPRHKDYALQGNLMIEMLSTGFAMALMLSIVSLGSMILQRSINHLGTQIIAAHAASRRMIEMLMMPLATVATAMATFVSQNRGANKPERIRQALRKVIWLELAWSLLSFCVALFAGRPLILLLTGSENQGVVNNALLGFRICTAFFFPLGLLLVLRTSMQAMGWKIAPAVSSATEMTMKIAACVWVIPSFGYLGVAVTEPAIWVVCAAILLLIYAANRNSNGQRESKSL